MDASERMSRVGSADTGAEWSLRRALWADGLRYRVQPRTPFGRPDLGFPAARVAVFVDGCYWHGCPWHYSAPRSRTDYWSAKLVANLARDRRQTACLEASGWSVLRLWEHDIVADVVGMVREVRAWLIGSPRPRIQWRVAAVTPVSRDEEIRLLENLFDPSDRRQLVAPRVTPRRPLRVRDIDSLPPACRILHSGLTALAECGLDEAYPVRRPMLEQVENGG